MTRARADVVPPEVRILRPPTSERNRGLSAADMFRMELLVYALVTAMILLPNLFRAPR